MYLLILLTVLALGASLADGSYVTFFLCCSLLNFIMVLAKNKELRMLQISIRELFASKKIISDDPLTIVCNIASIVFLVAALICSVNKYIAL